MLHESHAAVTWPALLVVVADNVLVVGVRVLREVPLDQVPRFLLREAEHDVELVNVAAVETDRMPRLCLHVLETHELVRTLWGPCQL